MAAAGRIIGRKQCPWCGFEGAHVRKNEGRNPYHYCPDCGYNVASRNGHQAELLARGMRPECKGGHADETTGAPIPPAGPADIRPAEPPPPPEPAARAKAGPFDVLLSTLKR
jgi:ssDNA-binding Zn-finger/Zn-ribbon topoisomerase 1